MDGTTQFFSLAVALLVFFVLFLLFREFWCWYFKINSAQGKLDLLDEQNRALREEIAQLRAEVRASLEAYQNLQNRPIQHLEETAKRILQEQAPEAPPTKPKGQPIWLEQPDYRPIEAEVKRLIEQRRLSRSCLACGQKLGVEKSAFCCQEHRDLYYSGPEPSLVD